MSEVATLEALGDRLPDAARDLRLNLGAVLGDGTLSLAQRWGSAITAALTARNPTAQSADGTNSHSTNPSGTSSRPGGGATWMDGK